MWCPPGVEGYWVQAPGAASDRVGVMLHGGGYTMGSAKGYRAYAAAPSGCLNPDGVSGRAGAVQLGWSITVRCPIAATRSRSG